MDWEETLIKFFLLISEYYSKTLQYHCERFSNNNTEPKFTDIEAMTLYLYGIYRGYSTTKIIYEYAKDHLLDFFPDLPSYTAFCYRLNRLAYVFPTFLEVLVVNAEKKNCFILELLIDSMPIILAQRNRAHNAKVAPELASTGYCPTKKLHYHGVKLHLIGSKRSGNLPFPTYIGISEAGKSDVKAMEEIAQELQGDLYGDKAYKSSERARLKKNGLEIITPIKKGSEPSIFNAANKLYSNLVSSIRQPIESFFNWINERTNLQIASKVRSSDALIKHVFSRLCVGLMLLQGIV